MELFKPVAKEKRKDHLMFLTRWMDILQYMENAKYFINKTHILNQKALLYILSVSNSRTFPPSCAE